MLKKTGLVLAAATAGLLAMSPLAWAEDNDRDHHSSYESEDKQVNAFEEEDGDVESNSQTQTCGNGTVNTPTATSSVVSTITQELEDLVPTDALGVAEPLINANGADADASTSTTDTCTQSADTGDPVTQTNSGDDD